MDQMLWGATLVGAMLLSFLSCDKEERATDVESLTAIYCGSCHLVPDPAELTRDRWEDFVLPRMGYSLGIYQGPDERAGLIESNAEVARWSKNGIPFVELRDVTR